MSDDVAAGVAGATDAGGHVLGHDCDPQRCSDACNVLGCWYERGQEGDGHVPGPFVLDLDSNPHPRMKAEAVAAHAARHDSQHERSYWFGFLDAMAAATGCEHADLIRWVERG